MTAPLLFLGHAADRTGPPIYLLHFMRWLEKEVPELEYELLLLAGGPLEAEFRTLAPTTVVDGWVPRRWWAPAESWLLQQRPEIEHAWWSLRRERQIRAQLRRFRHTEAVYVNTGASIELERLLPAGDRTVISHVHELDIGLRYYLGDRDRRLLLEGADQIFAASRAVRQNLIDGHGVDPSLVTCHYEMVDALAQPQPLAAAARADARRARGLPPDGFLVGSAGTIDWRKAVDLFLRMAWDLRKRYDSLPVTFVWIGGEQSSIEAAERTAARYGVADTVRFLGIQPDPSSWFRLLDVFVLPAREDAFPLVCLEAASAHCPVICFDNGGMPELVSQGCGFVVEYPDISGFTDRVAEVLEDHDLRLELGARGARLVRDHHDVTVLAPRLWADIEKGLP